MLFVCIGTTTSPSVGISTPDADAYVNEFLEARVSLSSQPRTSSTASITLRRDPDWTAMVSFPPRANCLPACTDAHLLDREPSNGLRRTLVRAATSLLLVAPRSLRPCASLPIVGSVNCACEKLSHSYNASSSGRGVPQPLCRCSLHL